MRSASLKTFLVLSLLIIDISILSATKKSTDLEVSFLDVGQGDSIFIESPTGTQVLIDTGNPGEVTSAIPDVINQYDRYIDILILSHDDKDHIGGAPEILEKYDIGKIILSGNFDNGGLEEEIIRLAKDKNIEIFFGQRGDVIDIGGGAFITILFPDRDASRFESNTASLGLKLTYGETDFILTGDMPSEIEEYLVMLDRDYLAAEVLKLGHHGSRTSTSEIFLAAVTPQYAVISAGEDNTYGHPHKEVTDRLSGLRVLDMSKTNTTLRFKSDGEGLDLIE